MREFRPVGFGIKRPDFYAQLIEMRLSHSGEYVRHVPSTGADQWVVMNYQFIPVSASVSGDYLVSGTNPRLWGYADHFAKKPEIYREGNSVKSASGSQFEVRGFLYNVRRVDINHAGYVSIELVQADGCAEVRDGFFEEQANLICPKIPECD